VPLALATAGPAPASPARTASLADRLDALNRQADQLVEEYDQGKLALDRTRRGLADLRRQTADAERALAALRSVMADRVAVAYVQGPATSLASVLSDNPAQAMDRVQVLDLLAQHDGDVMDQLKVATQAFEARRKALAAAEAEQSAQVARLQASKSKVEAAVAQTRALLAQIRAQDARRARQAAAQRRRAAPAAPPAAHPAPPPPPPSGGGGAPSGAAATAVRVALAQVGKPYQYGAAGPNAYDCSGLTMRAWGAAGVSLPHSAAAQYGIGVHVTRAELQPGDLAFFYIPISHVAMYIGNNQMVDATHTGSYVLVQTLRPAVGFTRPTG
jgi:cell wall-associated NlpC family hydrolase